MRPFALLVVVIFTVSITAPAQPSAPSNPQQDAGTSQRLLEDANDLCDRKEYVTRDAAAFSQLMDGVDSLEVFILDPAARQEHTAGEPAAASRLDGWKIVQRLRTTQRHEIEQLAAGLKLSIETGPDGAAPCFEPRHALKFTKEGKEVLVVVCFECISMDVKGYAPFTEAVVSHAAERDFYLVFRAHGQARPNRLAGLSDKEVAQQLVGKWRSKSRRPAGTGGFDLAFEEVEIFADDGTYQSEVRIDFVKKDGEPELFRQKSLKGQWRVQDGMLVLSGLDSESVAASAPVEIWTPVMEISPGRFTTGSLLPNSDKELVNERVPQESAPAGKRTAPSPATRPSPPFNMERTS